MTRTMVAVLLCVTFTAGCVVPALSQEEREGEAHKSPDDQKRLASVVTRLWLHSDCDRDLVAVAAIKLVEENKEQILDFLRQTPP